jgi:tocopherol O-methyltransferase
MTWTDLKSKIQRHYDVGASLYRSCWGIHVHHGYWRRGAESKEAAQEQLIEILADRAAIEPGSRILDVGCGFGGSCKYLAERFEARTVGISISPEQMRVAREITCGCVPRPLLTLMDAENLGFRAEFDVIWAIESISHLERKTDFFRSAFDLLAPNGRIAIVDWFKNEGLSRDEEDRYVQPIVNGMLLPRLETVRQYREEIENLGCRILTIEDISAQVSQTWNVCAEFATNPDIWSFALRHGADFVSFVQAFAAMRSGFASGAFRCALLVATKQHGLQHQSSGSSFTIDAP